MALSVFGTKLIWSFYWARSVQVSLVTHHLPLHEVFQFVRISYHVLVVLDLLVGLDDAEVDPCQVDLPRVLLVAVPNEREVRAQVLRRLLDAVLRARLVVEQAELECSLGLRLVHLRLLVAQVEYLHQVLDGLARVVGFRVGLGEKLVRLDLFLAVSRLLAKVEELLAVLDGAIQLALRLVNHTNLLVALGLDVLVLGALGNHQALLEELERHVELAHLQILVRDQLIHSHQVF